jgi:hypothetical protein
MVPHLREVSRLASLPVCRAAGRFSSNRRFQQNGDNGVWEFQTLSFAFRSRGFLEWLIRFVSNARRKVYTVKAASISVDRAIS